MKKTRFSEEQMVKILREADSAPVAELAKKYGVSEATIYAWRKRFGTLQAVDVKRLRSLEAENAKLKKLVAERDLEMANAPVRREQVAYVCRRGLSPRRACALLSVARSSLHYESRLTKRDATLLRRMRAPGPPAIPATVTGASGCCSPGRATQGVRTAPIGSGVRPSFRCRASGRAGPWRHTAPAASGCQRREPGLGL